MELIIVLVGLLLIVAAAWELVSPIDRRLSSWGRYKLPPGPKGQPIVGNMLDFWKRRREGTLASAFLEYRKYGEMTTLRMGSTLWVLLNTNRVTEEIIHKRAKLTHERPPMPISGNLVSRGMRSVTQSTAVWTELRRLMRPLLNDKWTRTFEQWQDFESREMLKAYVDHPEGWWMWNSRYATGVMYGVISGKRLGKTEEEMGLYRRTTMEFLGTIQGTVVDFFPWLGSLPMALQVWKAKWEAMGARHREIFRSWWDPIKAGVVASHNDEQKKEQTEQKSWVRDVVLNPETQFKGSEEEALYLTNTVLSAGGDNPRIAINTCLMACLAHPSAYKTCVNEITSLCEGASRLPSASDITSGALPYTCAFIKEVLRWRPVVPQVPPHTAAETFAFEDFVFPKGTSFMINVPAVCLDYADETEAFKPERWFDGNGGERKLTKDFWGFGGGKRICIGYKVALTAIAVPFARVVWGFEVLKSGEFDDRKVNSWSSGEPFPLALRCRSKEHEGTILRECERGDAFD